MSASRDPDVILAAWLDDGPEDLPSSTRRAIATAVRTTPQSRVGPLGPSAWRPPMSMPKAALAALAVLVVAISGFMLFGRSPEQPGAVGAPATAIPHATAPATASAAPTPTPAPAEVAPGITGWTPYTSEVYGTTFSLPDGWRQTNAATRMWQKGEPEEAAEEIFDEFANVDRNDRDGEGIAMLVFQMPAGSGADITSRAGLAAWVQENFCADQALSCENVVEPMCVGKTACLPAILVSDPGSVLGIIPEADAGLVTIVQLGRGPDFPATAAYGGGVQLVKSILTTMGVWTPDPGQVPSGG